jgi:hypothetical protein
MRHTSIRDTPALYFVLLVVQTALAILLFKTVLALFLHMISGLGEVHNISIPTIASLTGTAICMQCTYWYRYRKLWIYAPLQSALAVHVVIFVSQVTVFVSGGISTATFFRHLPALEFLPSSGTLLTKILIVLVIFFASFCYLLELERLGKTVEEGGLAAATGKLANGKVPRR